MTFRSSKHWYHIITILAQWMVKSGSAHNMKQIPSNISESVLRSGQSFKAGLHSICISNCQTCHKGPLLSKLIIKTKNVCVNRTNINPGLDGGYSHGLKIENSHGQRRHGVDQIIKWFTIWECSAVILGLLTRPPSSSKGRGSPALDFLMILHLDRFTGHLLESNEATNF